VYSGVQVGPFSKHHDPLSTNSGIHSRRYDTLCGQDILLPLASDAISASVRNSMDS
jgi:hypothetical protein